jgi:hypothetical protein
MKLDKVNLDEMKLGEIKICVGIQYNFHLLVKLTNTRKGS